MESSLAGRLFHRYTLLKFIAIDAMTEINSEEKKINELERLKYVEFYSQSYASFYNTTMEKDKSILTVSAGGIGFLITFINISGKMAIFEYIIFLLASISFITSILLIINIFGKNAEYIIALTTESEESDHLDCRLNFLDKMATIFFTIGLVLSLTLGASSSYKKIALENAMAEKKQTISSPAQGTIESFSGATQIEKSFSGASQLKPTVSQQSSNTNSGGVSSTTQAGAGSSYSNSSSTSSNQGKE